MWPGFKSQRRHHMWVEFVVGSLPCSKRFFSRYSSFPLSSKTNTSKFQFDLERTDTFKRVQLLCALWVKKQFTIFFIFYVFSLKLETGSYFLKHLKKLCTLGEHSGSSLEREVSYHSICYVMACRFYISNKLSTNEYSHIWLHCIFLLQKIRT